MKLHLHFIIVIILIGTLLILNSCKPEQLDENAKLEFSSSEITFDTVFTTIGSITRRFTVINRNNFPVTTDIYLASGTNSYYSINVDGQSGTDFQEVEIPAKDSIFVHVKVTINPGNQNNPFLVTDSILFYTGNSKQDVDLIAYGQDAHFIVADAGPATRRYKIIANAHETAHWTNEKPYVVYGWAAVDSLGSLIIDPGTKVYFHSGSGIWVYRYGNIQVNGTQDNPVYFSGDRLEEWYDTDYSQWSRIWINESSINNNINWAIVSNAFVGIQVESLSEYLSNTTHISNTKIQNTGNAGVIARACDVDITNCLFSNNGASSLQFEIGNFNVKHVTICNYFNQSERKSAAAYISNAYIISQMIGDAVEYVTLVGNTNAYFANTIIYGSLEDEIDVYTDEGANNTVQFENCIFKSKHDANYYLNCLRNTDPLFTDISKDDYTLQSSSPAINAGKIGLNITHDLNGNSRDALPDIGAYEYVNN